MSDVSLSALERIDGVCDRFEGEWLSGRRPRVAGLLGSAAGADRPALRRELLRVAVSHLKEAPSWRRSPRPATRASPASG
jgi:hypothetical protein